MLSHIRSDTGFMAGDAYSFFDPSMARLLGASKRSAGMDHWKFAVPLSTQMKGKASTLTRKNHENEDSQVMGGSLNMFFELYSLQFLFSFFYPIFNVIFHFSFKSCEL